MKETNQLKKVEKQKKNFLNAKRLKRIRKQKINKLDYIELENNHG